MSEGARFEVSRIHRLNTDSKLKAFVDISLGGFIVKGLRVMDGKNGLFVSMPRQQGDDGKWYNAAYPATKELQQELSEAVLKAYKE